MLLAALCGAAASASACDPAMAAFSDQASRAGQAVVIGRYVGDQAYSSNFLVEEVLSGTPVTGQYLLQKRGPLGSLCKMEIVEANGSTRLDDNPQVMLIESRAGSDALRVPFSGESARVIDGTIVTIRGNTGQLGGDDIRWLEKPETVEMALATFITWQRSGAAGPGPWQVVAGTPVATD